MDTEKLPTSRNRFLNFVQSHRKLLTWCSIFGIMILFANRHASLWFAVISSTCTLTPMVIMWALLQFVLLPRLLHNNRLAFFLLCILAIGVLVLLATQADIYLYNLFYQYHDTPAPFEEEIKRGVDGRYFLHGKYAFLLFATTIVVAISYLVTERNEQIESFHKQQMLEQVKYLRAQINPHFLFNALNCIYALTMTQDEKAPDSVLKLSEMLRYVIDDCRSDMVLLSKEIKYIQNYIDFQRIRMEQEPNLTFDVQVSDPNYKIPPMLLQPIIENCFKHSRLVDDAQAWVHISVRQNESGLLFTCDNSKPAATNFSRQSAIVGRQDEERTGIGLMNVQQRLEVLFGGACSLKVIEDEKHYKTILHI